MWPRHRNRACISTAVAAVTLACLLAGPMPAAQNVSGLDVFRTNCDGCHELPDPERPRRTRGEWENVLRKMVEEKGASLSRPEFTAVLNYLDSFNQPAREIIWKDEPAASHRAAFDTAQVGRLPDPWVNLTPGAAADTPWSLQADVSGKVSYLAPSSGVAEGQAQLLLDNSGTVTAGTLSTRFRISPGRGASGAGLVFGFRGPQSYFGVRLSPAAKNVLLYDVNEGQRSLLGRAAAAVATDRWLALSVTLAPNQAQVLLDGKPGLTRPLTRYRGGHVGLATEGATIAWFDQWAVVVAP